ncbi:hypothetical protein CFIMG_006416RA [Ceratocystis fimbriata CBS 114723]|uniref:Uncharacterized protein n=1 Tax=Ceratocystis fimbriata CBS 114723 TaxID=1035309 RepID=A0A2C5WUV3_9PEZI|nr:hypothetical protein CFIMG_006416RA [Ceratocystis fimbriata CBS 114723]
MALLWELTMRCTSATSTTGSRQAVVSVTCITSALMGERLRLFAGPLEEASASVSAPTPDVELGKEVTEPLNVFWTVLVDVELGCSTACKIEFQAFAIDHAFDKTCKHTFRAARQ